jgi:pilus assembly protein Flp/PilA
MFLRPYVRAQVWRASLRDRLLEDRGATAVEYALMLALIAAVIMGAVMVLGTDTRDAYADQTLQNALQ